MGIGSRGKRMQERAERYERAVIESARELTGTDVYPTTVGQLAELAVQFGIEVHEMFPARA